MNLEIREKGLQRAKNTFIKLAKIVGDLKPVWEEFLPYYRETILKGAFDTRGKMFNDSWENLAPSTVKNYKRRGINRKIRTLRLNDDLYNAATKGSGGWFENIKSASVKFGIDLPYAAAHQYGVPERNLPYSRFFFDDKEDLVPRAWAWLINNVSKKLEGADVK